MPLMLDTLPLGRSHHNQTCFGTDVYLDLLLLYERVVYCFSYDGHTVCLRVTAGLRLYINTRLQDALDENALIQSILSSLRAIQV
jgi:hypothetical protein